MGLPPPSFPQAAPLCAHNSPACLCPGPQEAIGFVKDVIANLEASKQPDTAEPTLYLKMQLAQYYLTGGELAQCKELVGEGREALDALADVSATCSSLGGKNSLFM